MLAIVIPYYKLTFFEATLESLSNQTDKRFKVYISDDCSLENCLPLLEKYNGKFDFNYYRFENNLGGTSLSNHWERSIALTNNEDWIMILGDDDILSENVVAEFYNQFSQFEGKTNLIRFASQLVDNIKNKTSVVFTHNQWEKASDSYYRRFKGQTRSSLSEYVFSKETFLKYNFHNYPLAWHSDDMAWLEFSDSKPIYTINESVVKILISDSSLSGMNSNLDLKNKATNQFYKDIIDTKFPLFSKKQRLELVFEYEVSIVRIKKVTAKEWFFIFTVYCKNLSFLPFIKFIRRILISIT